MTVATAYFNYQTAGTGHPLYAKGEAPAINSLQDYMLKRWGGQDLGSYGIRTIRGGESLSTHAFGAAWDWRYMNADQTGMLGRPKMLAEVLPFLINHSLELGVQFIADYVGCRIWKADRSGDANGGWRIQTQSSSGMGQRWAGWLHIEVHPNEWHDGANVDAKLGISGLPPFAPEFGLFSIYPVVPKPVIKLGATGDLVRYLQGVLRKATYGLPVDGAFGPLTDQTVKAFQRSRGLVVDGIVGRNTWAAIDAVALS